MLKHTAAASCALLSAFAPLTFRSRVLLCSVLAYLPFYLDGAERRPGSRWSKAAASFIRSLLRKALPRLFDLGFCVEQPDRLAGQQAILVVHPHGVLSLGHWLLITGFDDSLENALPSACRCALSAGVLFRLPFIRELCLLFGQVDASRPVAKRCLEQGSSISVVVGGEREQLLSQRGEKEELVLKKRQGFVRLALEYGVPLVPVYVFGESQLFLQSRLFLRSRLWLQQALGIALVMPLKPYLSSPLRLVVGPPLEIPRRPQPSQEEVDEHHARYINALEDLFERNKGRCGYAKNHLQLI